MIFKHPTCLVYPLYFFLTIDRNYDYTMDYMENVARNFTKKYPCYLIHKKAKTR